MKTPVLAVLSPSLVALVTTVSMHGHAAAAEAQATPNCPDAVDIARLSVERPVTLVSRWSTGAASKTQPSQSDGKPVVTLRDETEVHVTGLDKLLARAKCSPGSGTIVLFLDGRPVLSATPYPPVDPTSEKLKFVLDQHELRPTQNHARRGPICLDGLRSTCMN